MSRLKKAMKLAKEARESNKQVLEMPTEEPPRNIANKNRKVPNQRQEVKVTYSRTKVQRIDRDILRKNKVVSLFKNIKVTNEIDTLRTQILAKLGEIGGNSILVTSAHPGEGKTFTSINLGVSIAQQLDRTVLIVDSDLRNPWRYHLDFANDYFAVNTKIGLADYLMGDAAVENIMLNPGIEKLTIIPGGRPLPNSAELLGSKKMEHLVFDLKNRYSDRIVIFDSPALLACTDPLVFSHLIDGVILVVEAERTSPEDLKRVMALLKDRPVLGTVLNKSKEQGRDSYV
jgi:non-specific protein-tyrosine kinase